MPLVPSYDNLQTRVDVGPTPNVGGPNPLTIVGEQQQQVGAATSRASDALSRIMLDAQDQANQVRVNDAMNQAMGARLKLTHDKDAGYSALQGRAALDRPDGKALDQEFGDKLDETLATISAGLGNDAQRRVFQAQSGQLAGQFRGQVQAHMGKESQQYALSTAQGGIKVAHDQMALDYLDPQAVAQGRNAIKGYVAEAGRLLGLAPADVLARTVEALSPAHGAVLSAMLQGKQLGAAGDYLKEVRAEMTPADRSKFEGALKIGNDRAVMQAYGDSTMARGLSQADALADARKRFDGPEEDDAVKELKERYNEQEVGRARAVRQVGQAAWSAVMATGRIPADMLADLRAKAPEEERQIRDWQEARQRRAKSDAEGVAAKTDMNVYMGLRYMAMDPATQGQFSGLDLRKSMPYLSPGDLKHLQEVQASIGKGDSKAMESQRVVRQTLGVIRAEVVAAGIDLTPKEGTPKAKETALFMGALTQALDAAGAEKKAPLTAEEARRIGMSMVREGFEQGSGIFGVFATKKRGYQIATDTSINPGANFVAKRFGDIPAATRAALLEELYPKGAPRGMYGTPQPDEAAIERAYTLGLQRGRFK